MSLNETLLKGVVESIQTVLDSDPSEIKPDSKLVADLGAESIDFLDISCELEKVVGKEIDFKEVMNSVSGEGAATDFTVGDIVKFLGA